MKQEYTDLYKLYKSVFDEGHDCRGRAVNKPWEEHFMFLSLILAGPEYPVLEIGSLIGQSSLVFAEACRIKNTQFISVDPYPFHNDAIAPIEYFKRYILARYPEVRQYNCDLTECLDKIPEKLSFVYIDGCHDFEHPNREWNILFPRVVSGGWVAIDDIEPSSNGPREVAEIAKNHEDVLFYDDIYLKYPTEKITRLLRKR